MCEQIMVPLDDSASAGTSTATAPTDAEVARTVRTALALNKAVPRGRCATIAGNGTVGYRGVRPVVVLDGSGVRVMSVAG
jgi:hypothetical protein